MATDFEGRLAIITGAGKGIGRACAVELAARGADVVGIARTQHDLDQLEADIGCRTIIADLADSSQARTAIQQAGTGYFLINCAGTNVLESVLTMSTEAYETVMGINLRAALICAQEFARARVAVGGGGAILNVSSIAAHRGFSEHLCYAASKAGLEGATRVMAKELGTHNIRVNAVAPTVTMTELAEAAWSDPAKKDPMMVRHPLERFAEVEHVARSIIMLLSDDAPMVTGAVLPIDGGFLAV